MKKLLIPILASILLISACGPEAVPTISPEEVQGTAVAAAWTMVAETQAAIPTATPVPPTETAPPTALPTNTIAPLVIATQSLGVATQAVAAQPTSTSASNTDECNKLLQSSAAGPTAPIKIINETKAPINISLFLYKTVFGECGYRGYQVPKNGSINIEFPQGDITAYAWILEPVNKTVSGGPWRPNNTDKWEIYVREDLMKMVGP
jgi:hypothetical protein